MTGWIGPALRLIGVLLLLVLGAIVVAAGGFLGYVILDLLKTVGILAKVATALLFGGVAVGVWMWARSPRLGIRGLGTPLKPHRFVCHLRTLPGVVGGWFKAQVDLEVPSRSGSDIVVWLMCFICSSRGVRYRWTASYSVPPDPRGFEGQPFRMSVPVVFSIPADLRNTGRIEKSFLLIAVPAPDGSSFKGSFEVPIFDTTAAEPDEQKAEPAPVPEVVLKQIHVAM